MVFCLQDIINPPKNDSYKRPRQAVYRKNDYIHDLRKNYRELGLDLKIVDKIEQEIPEVHVEHNVYKTEKLNIEFSDKINVSLKVVNDKIHIEVNTLFYDLYENYFSKGLVPPLENQIDAYKSIGASEEFINTFINKMKHKKSLENKIDKMIEKVFEKEPKKKIQIPKKKEKEKEDDIVEDNDDEEEEEEEEDDTEEEALIDEDDIDEDEDIQEEEIEIDEE